MKTSHRRATLRLAVEKKTQCPGKQTGWIQRARQSLGGTEEMLENVFAAVCRESQAAEADRQGKT